MKMKTRERSRVNTTKKSLTFSAMASLAVCIALLSTTNTFNEAKNRLKQQIFGKFVLRNVEWKEVGDGNLKSFVTPELLWSTSGLKLGAPLIDVDLSLLEKKLKTIPWIETVDIQKHLSIGISVQYKTYHARALVIQNHKPYLFSSSGKVIAPLQLGNSYPSKLPVLSGFADAETALHWLDLLENFAESKDLAKRVDVHEITQIRDEIHALIALKYKDQTTKADVIFLLHGVDGDVKTDTDFEQEIVRLKDTVQYLINNNILVSRFDLRTGQKVVVNVGKRL